MLVLTRKTGEGLILDSNIEIAIVQVRGNKVRLGVTAPRHIPVHRAEVPRKIREGHAEQVNSRAGPRQTDGAKVQEPAARAAAIEA